MKRMFRRPPSSVEHVVLERSYGVVADITNFIPTEHHSPHATSRHRKRIPRPTRPPRLSARMSRTVGNGKYIRNMTRTPYPRLCDISSHLPAQHASAILHRITNSFPRHLPQASPSLGQNITWPPLRYSPETASAQARKADLTAEQWIRRGRQRAETA